MTTLTAAQQTLVSQNLELFTKLHKEAHDQELKRVAIVASKGTMDMVYPALILATTARAMGWECAVFFTFYGLDTLNKRKYKKLKVSPIANPAAPVPVPNIMGMIPGMTFVATKMMNWMMGRQKIPPITEMIDLSRELGVKMVACSTTMGVMGVKESDLIEGTVIEGAAAFLEYASKAHVTLFI